MISIESDHYGQLRVVSTPGYVSVNIVAKHRIVGTAEVSNMGDFWYTNRVLVKENLRRQGVGKQLVERMKSEVAAAGGTLLVVDPGGYADLTYAQQRAFYIACGFMDSPSTEGRLEWVPSNVSSKSRAVASR